MKIDKEKLVKIGELAKELGVTTRTIRYYEEIGIMRPPERLVGGARMYAKPDIYRLKFILKLKELGITLKEMEELAENYDLHEQNRDVIMPRVLEMLDHHIHKIDDKIANLSSLRKDIVDYRTRVVDILKEQEPIA